MQSITQINGIDPGTKAQIARILEQHDINITHQHLDEFIVEPLQDTWERHEMTVDLLQAIADSSFHTVVNNRTPITTDMAIQILQAMRYNRPIIFSELPDFADEVDTFSQRLIASRLHNFAVTNLTKLTDNQLRSVLRHLKNADVDYALSLTDITLIHANIRNYLRNLLKTPHPCLNAEYL